MSKKMTHEEFISRVSTVNSGIEIVSKYDGYNKKVNCKCLVHDYYWQTVPAVLLRGGGCAECSHRKTGDRCRKSQEIFESEVHAIDETIEIISEYVNSHEQIKCRCGKCGFTWWRLPVVLLRGSGCPFCSMTRGEKRIANYLSEKNIDYIYEKEFDGLIGLGEGNLSYDFYLPTHNLLIEYQGHFHDPQWKSTYKTEEGMARQLEHDRRKREFASTNKIDLLEIWYWDYDNIESILENKLSA